ncbi:hypothetical protein ANCDUO_03959 [Ancylostoma duodenale]|uniref:Uncharacterized protein n=1 Tax=Ancylostoma duodenale TaxID=51022 RepID=A0A0C2H892_9BILA|nr:hypothetical protein ANCDUO_03959 [Ancylostoma duodenale]
MSHRYNPELAQAEELPSGQRECPATDRRLPIMEEVAQHRAERFEPVQELLLQSDPVCAYGT